MRQLLLWTAVSLLTFALAGCDTPPPKPKVEWTPSTGRLMAGESLEVRATKPLAKRQENFEFSWTMEGDCAGTFEDPSSWKASYQVPAECAGGKLTILLEAKTRFGVTKHQVGFRIEPAKEKEDTGLTPVWVDPLPESWMAINTYDGNVKEKKRERRNNRGALFGTWTYRDGRCKLVQGNEDGHQVLELQYSLPHADLSSCGYFEYIQAAVEEEGKKKKGEAPPRAEKVDISGYEKIGFVARSKEGKKVAIRLELVEFDKYANYNQGIVSPSPVIIVDGKWRRYEFDLRQIVRTWDLKSSKSIGFRVDAKDDNTGSGTLLLDNFVLIKP